jgi:RNA polymerase sigma-70 factor (ECF subfamily)
MTSKSPDLERLLRQARAGDDLVRGALLELYRNYLELLARVQIGRHLQAKIEAADLVQETFLAAHRDFGTFRGNTEPELAAWLRQILAGRLGHVLRAYFNTHRRNLRLEQQLAEALDQSSQDLGSALAAPGSTPSHQAMRKERAVLLANALKALSAEQAEVLTLHHLEGFSFAEVAQRMGKSLGSIKQLWMRALGRLRRELGEDP